MMNRQDEAGKHGETALMLARVADLMEQAWRVEVEREDYTTRDFASMVLSDRATGERYTVTMARKNGPWRRTRPS